MVEWDEEPGEFTPVQQKQIVDVADPNEGDHVKVKECKHIYGGVVKKKGNSGGQNLYSTVSTTDVVRGSGKLMAQIIQISAYHIAPNY